MDLHTASIYGHTGIVRMLLEQGGDVEAKDDGGWTALIWASRNGYQEIVTMLLDKEADVNAIRNDGYTALTEATSYRHTEIVAMLLDKGADVNAKNSDGITALTQATSYRHTEIVELLEKAIETEKKIRGHKQSAMELIKEDNTQTDNIPQLAARAADKLTAEDIQNINRESLDVDKKTGKLYYGEKKRTSKKSKKPKKSKKTRSKKKRISL